MIRAPVQSIFYASKIEEMGPFLVRKLTFTKNSNFRGLEDSLNPLNINKGVSKNSKTLLDFDMGFQEKKNMRSRNSNNDFFESDQFLRHSLLRLIFTLLKVYSKIKQDDNLCMNLLHFDSRKYLK
jgi:hypothetical protein